MTAVSELVRNVCQYAGGGTFRLEARHNPPGIEVRVEDHGPGIANLEEILSGNYRGNSGLGLGLAGCQRIRDEMRIDTSPGLGTRIVAHKSLR